MPVARLVERGVDRNRVLPAGMVIAGVGLVLLASISSFGLALLTMTLVGVAWELVSLEGLIEIRAYAPGAGSASPSASGSPCPPSA